MIEKLYQAKKDLNILDKLNDQLCILKAEERSLLETQELIIPVSYGFRSDFGQVRLLVSTESVLAALTRDISLVEAQMEQIMEQVSTTFGV